MNLRSFTFNVTTSFAMLVAVTTTAIAQTHPVPAYGAANSPTTPGVNLMPVDPPVALSAKDKTALRIVEEWRNSPDKARRGPDGSIKYLFGATLPALICAPLRVCNLLLQPGEFVQKKGLQIGDSARWQVTPGYAGEGSGEYTILAIKPTQENLRTNLSIYTTKRVYTLDLISHPDQWMPNVSFDYPDDVKDAWDTYYERQNRTKKETVLPNGFDLARLDFGYRISGDKASWRPLRVYSYEGKTFIQFPQSMQEAPTLIALDGDTETLVNYRMKDGGYLVDKVLERAALVLGVGDAQTKVEITKVSAR